MRAFVASLFLSLVFVPLCAAQTGITVEGIAGLSFPTDSDFGDGYETGLALGVRGAYGITDNLHATVGLQYNRYSSKDSFVESAASKSGGTSGSNGFDPNVTYNLFGIRGGVRYEGVASETMGYFAGVEVGPMQQKAKSDFGESDGIWDLSAGVYAGGRYFFTPTASVGVGPAFNIVFAESSYHFLDVVVNVAFGI